MMVPRSFEHLFSQVLALGFRPSKSCGQDLIARLGVNVDLIATGLTINLPSMTGTSARALPASVEVPGANARRDIVFRWLSARKSGSLSRVTSVA